MRQDGIDGREDAGKGDAAHETPNRKLREILRNGLNDSENAGKQKSKVQGRSISPALSKHAPRRGGNHAGDADNGKDDAGNKHDAIH